MERLTRIALERRTVLWTVLCLAFGYGLYQYVALPRAEDPGFTPRTALVTTYFPGGSPLRVERLVTDPVEAALQEIEELDYLESESRQGASVVYVRLSESELDVRARWDEVRRRMRDLAPALPSEVRGPFVDDDFGDVFGVVLGLTGDGFALHELEDVADLLRLRLLELPDVGKVAIYGAPERRIFLDYERERLARVGLGPGELARTLRARNVVEPAGFLRTERGRLPVDVDGSLEGAGALRRAVLPTPGGELVALGDLVDVREAIADPPRRMVRDSGEPALMLAASMRDGGKITRMGPAVLDVAERFQEELPAGMSLRRVAYRAELVDANVDAFVNSLLQGVAAVFLVMLVALGFRTGVVVALVIPMTMVASLLVMSVLGISLNKMSLAALILALGLLVDNAIVVSEAILVAMREGRPPMRAALESVRELRFPLLVASLTTAAALLPTYLAESATGEYTSALFEVVTIALLASWLLALTMMPSLCTTFLRSGTGAAKGDGGDGSAGRGEGDGGDGDAGEGDGEPAGSGGRVVARMRRWHERGLLWMLRHRLVTVGAMAAVLASALYATRWVPQQFFPRKTEPTFTVELELPYGTPFERTDEVVAALERFVGEELRASPARPAAAYDREGVVGWASFVGSGGPRFVLGYAPEPPRPNYAWMLFDASSYEAQRRLLPRVRTFLREHFPDVTARVRRLQNGPPVEHPVEVRVSGTEIDPLFGVVEDVVAKLRSMPGPVHVGTDWGLRRAKVDVRVDDAAARYAGVSHRDVATALQAALDGVPLDVLRDGDELVPIVLRSRDARGAGLRGIENVSVAPRGQGPAVPLRRVARVGLDFEPPKILRRDRKRTVTVHADLAPGAPGSVTAFSIADRLRPWLEDQARGWPMGYDFAFGGEVETSGDAQASIRAKMPVALVIIALLLVMQFDALRPPLVVLATLPFALIGAIVGLLVTQKPFGFVALMGVIALFGIVLNNAIVLLDRVEIEMREGGLSRHDALVRASQRRLRPILLTTATTVGGLLPLWFGGGPMFSPMAVAIIFGLVGSTVVTLGLAPVLYAFAYRLRWD